MLDIIVGQTVYVKAIHNAARYKKQEELIEEAIVETVGRKWFTLKGYYQDRFSLENGYHDGGVYASQFIVYEDRQTILDEIEIQEKCQYIGSRFACYSNPGMSIEQIRRIYDELQESK
jgi:hypothetical protein